MIKALHPTILPGFILTNQFNFNDSSVRPRGLRRVNSFFDNTVIAHMSTRNVSYGWFVASTPYTYTANYWWGQSTILNQRATTKTEGFLWAIAGGAEVSSATAAYLSWAPFGLPATIILAAGAGLYGGEAGLMEGVDNGYGDHCNETWTSVPLGIYANVP